MITDRFDHDEARIRLTVLGLRGQKREIEAVIDTGYTDSLTLPRAIIVAFGLQYRSVDRAILADGSECLFDVYKGARVVWDGELRSILVGEADGVPLVGMTLLRGFEMNMLVRPGGKVTIRRLPAHPKRRGA